MAAPRYSHLDEYTALEVQRGFELGDRAERIAVMQAVFDVGAQLPYEVALDAASGADVGLRSWLARHGRELQYYDRTDGTERPANIWELLDNDPDPLVRLALHENPASDKYQYLHPSPREFRELTKAERLAAIRNPRMAANGVPGVVLSIFDPENTAVTDDPHEREQLAFAYLTNERAVRASHDFAYPRHIRYDPVSYTFEKEREKLWHLVAAFPDQSVRWYGLRYLGAKDEWKAAAYRALLPISGEDEEGWENSERARLRAAILYNCTEEDTTTLALGVDDRDEDCHEIARQKYLGHLEKRSRFWRVAGHVWVAIQNLVALLVILAILNAGETRFEKVVIAGVVYLFLTVTTLSMQLFATYRGVSVALDGEFERLRRLVGEKPSAREAEMRAQQREEIRWTFAKANVNYIIASIVLFLGWIATLIALLDALL